MDLSIIIINYNTKKITSNCLKTIQKSSDKLNKEVIVVDNGSEDGSLEYLKRHFPAYTVISSRENIGFAKGNNFGFSKSKGKYIWLLNSDTILEKNTINTLMKLVKKNNSKIASCKLLNPDQTTQPQGGSLPSLFNLTAWMLFIDDLPIIKNLIKPYQQRNLAYYQEDQHPGWLGGTALIVKRDIYKKLNGLDKDIFMYGEDVDFCFRAKQQGVTLDYFAKPQLTHLGQASGSSRGAILGEYKGLKYIFNKHFNSLSCVYLKFILKLGAFLRIIIFGFILRDKSRKSIYAEAYTLA